MIHLQLHGGYGCKKFGTRARVFSQTPAHVNSKIIIRQEADKDDKKRCVSVERRNAGTKKRSPDGVSKYHYNKHNIVVLFKLRKKYNEIQ